MSERLSEPAARKHTARLLAVATAIALVLTSAACGSGASASDPTDLEKPGPSSSTPFVPATIPTPVPPETGTPGPSGSPPPTRTPPDRPEPSCPSRALLGVYSPERYHVVARCVWFVGIVARVARLGDGDLRVFLVPTRAYQRLLNAANVSQLNGLLIADIIQGQVMQIFVPDPGERLAVLGTLVRDVEHGWNEIHPIWEIRYLDSGTDIYAPPPDPPEYDPGTRSP